jgi:hypothetical protein
LGTLFDHGIYLSARVEADDDVATLAHHIDKPQEALDSAVTARKHAKNAYIRAQARRDAKVRVMNLHIKQAVLDAGAHYGSRTAEEIGALFGSPPSRLTETPDQDRVKDYSAFVERLGDAPAALHPIRKKILAGWVPVQKEEKAVALAEKALDKAAGKEAKAREDWVAGYVTLGGMLTAKFPKDKPRVESYFRQSKAGAKAKKDAPPQEPAPG